LHIFDDKGNYSKEYTELLAKAKVKVLPSEPKASDQNLAFRPSASYLRSTYPDAFGSGDNTPQKVKYGTSYQNATYQNIDKKVARRAVRQASFDSSIAKGIMERFTNAIVDSGLVLNLTPEADILGISNERAAEVAEDVNKRFHLWAKSKYPSKDRTQTLYQLTRLICYLQQRDNDYFIKFDYDLSDPNINPLSLSLIEPDDIYGNADDKGKIPKDNPIIDGIQYNKKGVEIAYFVNTLIDGQPKRIRIPAFDPKSGLPIMIHGFSIEFVGQKRGMPLLYNSLQECEQLQTFTLAQIESAIKQSSIAMWIKPTNADAADFTQDLAAMRDNMTRELSEEDLSNNFADYLNYQLMPEANFTPGDVGIFNLKKGEELKGFDTTSPTEQFSSFTKAFISHLAIARSMPYEYLMMEFGENYSASRATLVLAFRVALMWQRELESDALNTVKEVWCYGEIAANRISMSGFSNPLLRSAWLSCEWIGPPMVDIDPAKSVKAKKDAISIGATTLGRTAREINGSSYQGNVAQLEQELESLPQVPWEEDKNAQPIQEGLNDD